VIAAHHIHDNSHNGKKRENESAPRFEGSGCCFDGNDLPAFIKTASGADPVRDIRSRALRAGAELRHLHGAIVGSTHPLTAV